MDETDHLVGLLLGTEEDWPTAFETLVDRLGPVEDAAGAMHRMTTERITMEPFDLRDKGLRCELDVWGHDVPHDWPSWRAQLAHHLPRFC